MRFCPRSLVVLSFVFSCASAKAEEWKFEAKEAGGKLACQVASKDLKASPAELVAHVSLPEGLSGALEITAGGKTEKKEGTGTIEVRVAVASAAGATFSVEVLAKKDGNDLTAACLKDQHFERTSPAETRTPGSKAGVDQRDGQAWAWLTSDGLEELRSVEKASRTSGATALIHFPSGNVASATLADRDGKSIVDLPFPHSLPEGSRIQAYIVMPMDEPGFRAELVVTDCPARERVRILGDEAGTLQAKSLGAKPFKLIPIGPELRCGAPRMSYRIGQVSETTPEISIVLRPRYHLAATFLWGFDMLKEPSYFVGSDKKIAGREETVGPSFRVGFTWFPGGMDLEDEGLKAYPFLAFDPKAAQDSFVVGLAISKLRGISLAVGATVRKVTVLDGKSVGDTVTGDGAVPTRKVWSKDGVGFLVGISLDTTAFKKVKTVFGGLTQ